MEFFLQKKPALHFFSGVGNPGVSQYLKINISGTDFLFVSCFICCRKVNHFNPQKLQP